MNKYKVLIMMSVLSLVILLPLGFVNVGYLQIILKDENKKESHEFCSNVSDILKFCTNSQKIIINSGDAIVLNFSLKNVGGKEIRVKTNRDLSKYNIKVTNESGEVILTKLEKKIRDNIMSYDDQKDFINSQIRSHHSEVLKPDHVLTERFVISDIYDFTMVGKYYVEITRNTMNPTGEGFVELPLEKIEIEVLDPKQ